MKTTLKYLRLLICIHLFIIRSISAEDSNFLPVTQKFIKIYIPVDEESINKKQYSIDARIPQLRMVVKFPNSIRSISKAESNFFDSIWTMNVRLKELKTIKKQILFTENNENFWVYANDGLIAQLQERVKKNEAFSIYVSYFGHSYDKKNLRMFILNNFDSKPDKPIGRHQFTDTIMDFKLGSNLKQEIQIAVKRFGEPIDIITGRFKNLMQQNPIM